MERTQPMPPILVTHTRPDMDAITAAWLIDRFVLQGTSRLAFIGQNERTSPLLSTAAAVVDVAGVFDPATYRYDHHDFEGDLSIQESATSLVAADLLHRGILHPCLDPLVAVVTDADGRDVRSKAALFSRRCGLHGLLSWVRYGMHNNDELTTRSMMGLLDMLARTLYVRAGHPIPDVLYRSTPPRLTDDQQSIGGFQSPARDAVVSAWVHHVLAAGPMLSDRPDTDNEPRYSSITVQDDPPDSRQSAGMFLQDAPATMIRSLIAADSRWAYLHPLADMLDETHPDHTMSRTFGLHAIWEEAERTITDPSARTGVIWDTLDGVHDTLLRAAQGEAEMHRVSVFRENDVLATWNGTAATTFTAFDHGYRLVIFCSMIPPKSDDPHCRPTIAIGIQVRDDMLERITARDIIDRVRREGPHGDPDVLKEITRWYIHPGGFFAGRGTRKAPDPTPLCCSYDALRGAIVAAYRALCHERGIPPAPVTDTPPLSPVRSR